MNAPVEIEIRLAALFAREGGVCLVIVMLDDGNME
jgi:hypothetical protein